MMSLKHGGWEKNSNIPTQHAFNISPPSDNFLFCCQTPSQSQLFLHHLSHLSSSSFPSLSPLSSPLSGSCPPSFLPSFLPLFVMSYSSSSGPFWVGTVIFLLLGLLACFISNQCYKRGKNPELGLSYVMISMTIFCCWMFWGMCWLMQWHPLIFPIKEIHSETS